MSGAIQELVAKLASEGEKTTAFFGGLAPDIWNQSVYSDEGRWTTREILAHIVQTEKYLRRLMVGIKGGQAGLGAGFDLDKFNREQMLELSGLPIGELLELFQARRRETISWLRSSLTEEDLGLRGWHPGVGETSLEKMARLIYLHTQSHQRDILRKIRADQHA